MTSTFFQAVFAFLLWSTAADAFVCVDDSAFKFKNKINACKRYVAKKPDKVGKRCQEGDGRVFEACKSTCENCACIDDADFFLKKKKKNCDWVAKKPKPRCKKRVKHQGSINNVWDHCRIICGLCTPEENSDAPSTSISDAPVSMPKHSHFTPLPCNGDFSMPCHPLDFGDVGTSMYVVPCGTCQILDGNHVDAATIANFAGGLNVEGQLQILPPTDAASTLWIKAPTIFVQGKLTVDTESFPDRSGAIHIDLVEGDGDVDVMMVPHPSNSMACASSGNGACNVGKRPFVVAGGEVDIRGYKHSCPSWTNLVDVVLRGMAQLEPSQYEQYSGPPSAECSSVVVSQNFDSNTPLSDLGIWDGNGATGYNIITEAGYSYYKVFSRTSAAHGPRVRLTNPKCLTPGATYLLSTKLKLSGPSTSDCSQSGGNCPILMLYRKTDTGSQKWRRLSAFDGKYLQDDTWGTLQLQVTFNAEEVGPSSNNQMMSLFMEGPEASVDISVDEFLFELAPPGTFPNPVEVCAELLPNGDAEHGSGANIFPFTFAGGEASVVTENDNSFFRQSRRYMNYSRLNTKLVTGCVVYGVIYQFSAKVWVHSSVPTQAEIVVGSAQPDGSMDWSTLIICPSSRESSGFVSCEAMISFSSKQITASDITLFLRPRGDTASTIDWDDLSLQFVAGPVEELLVDPTLHDCWEDQISEGSEILVTSHTLDFTDSQVVSISGMTADGKISLTGPITNPTSGPDDFKVEVALLSRRITLEASSDSSVGGHFIVLHTPDVEQTIRGVQIKGFGQQGILGRYPIHFHMCGNVYGSIVSKNIIRDSNQRCLVVHGTDSLLIEDNVAYNNFGHCFTLEDGGEVDNVFRNNLGALTKKVSTLISNDETDDEPSTYWITNPQNSFENNVAAGSEGTGFWFELRTRVRGPSADFYPGVNPSRLPLKYFVGNVAHSNMGSGLATYPGAGYNPDEEATFVNMKSYRNRGGGIFFHNSAHLSIQGGSFADNRIGIDVDRAYSLRIVSSHFVGVTPSFAASVSSSGKRGHCPSMTPVIGIQLHSSQLGGNTQTGVILQDLSFAHLGEDTLCPGSSALGVDPRENFEFFDPRTSVEGLQFDAYTSKLNLCQAVDSGINVAIKDKDASLISIPGFIVSDNAEMTTFSSCMAEPGTSCALACHETCLRTLSLSVSSLTPENLKLVVKDEMGDAPSISLSGYFDFRDWDPYWNTRSHFTRRFFVTLPVSGSYQARFILDNQIVWPVFVERSWEDVDGCGPAFSMEIDESGARNCNQLIVNGDGEDNSVYGWWHTAGGISTVEGGADGSSFSFSSQFREYSSFGIAQFLDTRCMVEGRKYMLQAFIKLINQDGSIYTCTPGNNVAPCPEAYLRSRIGTTNPVDSVYTIPTMDSWATSNSDWNIMTGIFTVSGEQANAGSVLLAWHRTPAHVEVIMDEITLSLVTIATE